MRNSTDKGFLILLISAGFLIVIALLELQFSLVELSHNEKKQEYTEVSSTLFI